MIKPLSAPELKAWLDDSSRPKPILLDVREAWELDKCRLDGVQHIPMRDIPARQQEIDAEQPVVCICHHGARSMQVALFLDKQQPGEIYNLTGGVDAWTRQVDPAFPAY